MNKGSILFFLLVGFSAWAEGSAYVDQPAGCWEHKVGVNGCAVRALHRTEFLVSGVEIHVAKGTSFVWRKSPGPAPQMELVQGSAFVHMSVVAEPLQIKHGQVLVSGHGDFWLEHHDPGQLLLINLDGDVRAQSSFFSSGLSEVQEIPVGFTNWFGGLNQLGQIDQGVLQPINAVDFLPRWNHTCHWPRAQAQKALQAYRQLWHDNNVAAANLYHEVIVRRLASQQSDEQALRFRRAAAEREKQKLRDMFRERYDLTKVPLAP